MCSSSGRVRENTLHNAISGRETTVRAWIQGFLEEDDAERAKPSGDGYDSVAEQRKDPENSACAQDTDSCSKSQLWLPRLSLAHDMSGSGSN
jgi:hypothetical protein